MGDMYIGTIILWSLKNLPQGFVYCNGQLLLISQYEQLFDLIGISYGGDGITTFGVPDLRSRLPIGAASGTVNNALTPANLGTTGGSENKQLTIHTHTADVISIPIDHAISGSSLSVSSQQATDSTPFPGASIAALMSSDDAMTPTINPAFGFNTLVPDTKIIGIVDGSNASATSGNIAISSTGTSANGNYANMQPFLSLNYIICTQGIVPQP